jgi:hypothetical protein
MPQWIPAGSAGELFPARPPALEPARPPAFEPEGPTDFEPAVPAITTEAAFRRGGWEDLQRGGPGPDLYTSEAELRAQRRRKEDLASMLKAGLLVVGCAVVIIVIAVIVVNAASRKPDNPQSFYLGTGHSHAISVEFKAGQRAEVWVTSVYDSDVDVFVFDEQNNLIVADEADSKDCYVSWSVTRTQRYRIEVANRVRLEPQLRYRNRPNQCTVKYSPP